jgi:flagella basal body P-ring formation protein FlgA
MKKLTWFLMLFSLSLMAVSTVNSVSLIEERLREEVLKELSPEARVTVENIHAQMQVPLSATLVSLNPRPAIGMVQFVFSWVEKGQRKESSGNAMIKAYLPVAVAKGPIRHNEAFESKNVKFEERDISYFRNTGYFESSENLFNLRANGYLSPGSVIGFQHTQEAWIVSQGQAVELVNQRGPLKVTARMIALENGKKDQWIRLENPVSKKVVRGRVSKSGDVRLK